ncbi:MAG: sulfate adenylyltransferase [Aigarchaeota archaeon]|nr:sulfate adenylyltransferase [Aigarchaeota archaeon]MDW7986882.1 sulfate adenylyltransferase [Nitrososphaerota archaeon]
MVSLPHGGKLVNRVVEGSKREARVHEANEVIRVDLDESQAADIENIAYGVYSPLEGFMTYEEVLDVLEDMRLPNDLPWTIPIILNVPNDVFSLIKEGDEICLTFQDKPIAYLTIEEKYSLDKKHFCEKVFKTYDPQHPGVLRIIEKENKFLGGAIELVGDMPNLYERYFLRPIETRILFIEKGWKTIAGFQTRNAPHLGHEYIQKAALVFIDGLFINPVIGKKKIGDFKDDVILRSYEALISNYYPKDTVVMSILRYEMKYAGPREAVHHAIMRKNFGCTHFIVGRDHAGVGNYYKPYEAWEIFNMFPDLGITPLFVSDSFYCRKCYGMVTETICPHGDEHRMKFSGTQIRQMILRGERPPPEIMRPEVADVIMSFPNPFVEV